MEYSFKQSFLKAAECTSCMLSFGKLHTDGETHQYCSGLGSRPACPEDGCRSDCPLESTIHAQRQDGLLDQLKDLRILANEYGMYDAADWVGGQISKKGLFGGAG